MTKKVNYLPIFHNEIKEIGTLQNNLQYYNSTQKRNNQQNQPNVISLKERIPTIFLKSRL
jgi:hypothetical protein